MEISPLRQRILDFEQRLQALKGFFQYDAQSERLEELAGLLAEPDIWRNPEKMQALTQERARLEKVVHALDAYIRGIAEAKELLELAVADEDVALAEEVTKDVEVIGVALEALEFRRMFSGEMDDKHAYLDVQAGSGGTEAQDWAEMLLRMYLRWGERQGLVCTVIEASPGEVAGIKSATVQFAGDYAYGLLRTEIGVHRLVRKSPFDSGNRRHTSFAAIFVSPIIDETVHIEINPADLRIDTYRASGAGGQHVNRTDSAVRITHMPSGIVVQCQNERSQHKNRDHAMSQLRAKLYQEEMRKRQEAQQALEATKSVIGWGSQIRSYVLDDSRVKDLRTGFETSNTQGVLDGNLLQAFIEASLKSGI